MLVDGDDLIITHGPPGLFLVSLGSAQDCGTIDNMVRTFEKKYKNNMHGKEKAGPAARTD
jgi:hypothetical protein